MLQKIIKISALWCGPCKAFTPIFDKVSQLEKYKDITFTKIDTDETDEDSSKIIEKFDIRSIPTVLFLDENDKLLKKTVGLISEQNLINIIDDTLNNQAQ